MNRTQSGGKERKSIPDKRNVKHKGSENKPVRSALLETEE